MKKLTAIALLLLVGCQSPTGHSLSKKEWLDVVERARASLLASGTLTAEQIVGVKMKNPSLAYDFPYTPGARYFIHFELSPYDVITIQGEGDIRTLENARIRERPPSPPSQNRLQEATNEMVEEVLKPRQPIKAVDPTPGSAPQNSGRLSGD